MAIFVVIFSASPGIFLVSSLIWNPLRGNFMTKIFHLSHTKCAVDLLACLFGRLTLCEKKFKRFGRVVVVFLPTWNFNDHLKCTFFYLFDS